MDPETKDHGMNGAGLYPVKTEGSIIMTPEMFEKMYLAPANRVHGDLRRTLGNPTPIGLGGFLVAYSPIIFSLLGWRGYNYSAALPGTATVGTYYFSGGLLAVLAGIMEFILGNSFPATFYLVFGGYFISYGATITPYFDAYAAYSPDPINKPGEGLAAPAFLNGLGFWNVLMGVFTFYCTICALRTNILFFLAFLFLTPTFFLNAASTWVLGEDLTKTAMAHTLQVAAGSTGFVTLVIGWYLLLVLMLSTVDFPGVQFLPVGDLSTVIPSASQMAKKQSDVEKQE